MASSAKSVSSLRCTAGASPALHSRRVCDLQGLMDGPHCFLSKIGVSQQLEQRLRHEEAPVACSTLTRVFYIYNVSGFAPKVKSTKHLSSAGAAAAALPCGLGACRLLHHDLGLTIKSTGSEGWAPWLPRQSRPAARAARRAPPHGSGARSRAARESGCPAAARTVPPRAAASPPCACTHAVDMSRMRRSPAAALHSAAAATLRMRSRQKKIAAPAGAHSSVREGTYRVHMAEVPAAWGEWAEAAVLQPPAQRRRVLRRHHPAHTCTALAILCIQW